MIEKEIAGRYQVKHKLGSGGMGTVYRGLDMQTETSVAIKHLRLDMADPDLIERFQREGQALRDLNHPNMVKMLDSIEENGNHYLVMEYVDGGDLADLIDDGQLPTERVLELGIDLADALTRAHRLGIIHRDLKPANILIAHDGTLRLTDFGVAHIADKRRVTETDALVGTIDYLAPEAFQYEGIDNRADIWAFGVMLFEMLTGERPFTGDSITQLMYAIISGEIPDLEALRENAPIALIDLINRMLEKDPNQRVPSVRIVGAALEAILEGRAIHTPPASRFSAPPTDIVVRATHNLPAQVTEFVGRVAELAELERLLGEQNLRLLTIVAPGGMGKTRLSLAAAERQLENFKDGVFFVELAPLTDPNHIVSAIADAIDYQFQSDNRGQKEQLLDFLGNKTLLLVMDNFEHLSEGASLVTDILNAAANVQVLATSRQRLALAGETLFHLSGMEFPDWETPEDALDYAAVKLFMQGAKRARPAFELGNENLDYVARICRLVAGMPLGIVLSAAWLGLLSVEEVAEELQQGIDFLEGDGGDVPNRQRSIRVVFDYSWEMMTDDEQAVFMQLSVFRGGFTRQAGQAVTGAILKILMGLVNKSLLRREAESGRYHIHELLRQYASEKLESRGDINAVRDAHSQYYTDALHQLESDLKGSRQMEAVDRITSDIENVHAAWLWAAEQHHLDNIQQALESLFIYYMIGLRNVEGVAILNQARIALEQDEPTGQHALVLAKLLARQAASVYADISQKRNAERSLAILHRLNERLETAPALTALGWAYRLEGDFGQSEQFLREAIAIGRESGDDWWLAYGLSTLGWIYGVSQNETEDGQSILEEALQLVEKTGDLAAKVTVLSNLGVVAGRQGLHEEEIRYKDKALAIARQLRLYDRAINVLNNLGWATYEIGDYERAYQYLSECMEMSEQLGRHDNPFHLLSMAHTLYAMKKHQDAKSYFARALASINKNWVFECAIDIVIGIANIFADEGQPHRAAVLLGLALPHNEDPSISRLGNVALERLNKELESHTLQSAWEQGQSLDLKMVVQELLEEFEG